MSLDTLPQDLLILILGSLGPAQCMRTRRVCKSLNESVNDESMWTHLHSLYVPVTAKGMMKKLVIEYACFMRWDPSSLDSNVEGSAISPDRLVFIARPVTFCSAFCSPPMAEGVHVWAFTVYETSQNDFTVGIISAEYLNSDFKLSSSFDSPQLRAKLLSENGVGVEFGARGSQEKPPHFPPAHQVARVSVDLLIDRVRGTPVQLVFRLSFSKRRAKFELYSDRGNAFIWDDIPRAPYVPMFGCVRDTTVRIRHDVRRERDIPKVIEDFHRLVVPPYQRVDEYKSVMTWL